jgi:hypothetical protein
MLLRAVVVLVSSAAVIGSFLWALNRTPFSDLLHGIRETRGSFTQASDEHHHFIEPSERTVPALDRRPVNSREHTSAGQDQSFFVEDDVQVPPSTSAQDLPRWPVAGESMAPEVLPPDDAQTRANSAANSNSQGSSSLAERPQDSGMALPPPSLSTKPKLKAVPERAALVRPTPGENLDSSSFREASKLSRSERRTTPGKIHRGSAKLRSSAGGEPNVRFGHSRKIDKLPIRVWARQADRVDIYEPGVHIRIICSRVSEAERRRAGCYY